jgi:hypothetical protein
LCSDFFRQKTSSGVVYLWCGITGATVGRKSLTVTAGGQTQFQAPGSINFQGVCAGGWYGQEAYSIFTEIGNTGKGTRNVECVKPCTPSLEGDVCTAYLDREESKYKLLNGYTTTSDACEKDWACLQVRAASVSVQPSVASWLSSSRSYCACCTCSFFVLSSLRSRLCDVGRRALVGRVDELLAAHFR